MRCRAQLSRILRVERSRELRLSEGDDLGDEEPFRSIMHYGSRIWARNATDLLRRFGGKHDYVSGA